MNPVGSLNVPHAIAFDGRGNICVGENFDARGFQRFLYKGLGTPAAGANQGQRWYVDAE
jgi:hypothetical protein